LFLQSTNLAFLVVDGVSITAETLSKYEPHNSPYNQRCKENTYHKRIRSSLNHGRLLVQELDGACIWKPHGEIVHLRQLHKAARFYSFNNNIFCRIGQLEPATPPS